MSRLFLLLLAGCLLMSAKNPPAEGIEFYQGSFTSAKLKAAQEGRLFFLDFTASWCTPCRWMEETTFTDPTLAAYVKENYVALKVDIDDFDGFALKQEYNIQILPSLLIFNSKGELLGQYEESLSPSRMLEILKQYDQPRNRIMTQVNDPRQSSYTPPPTYNASTNSQPNINNNTSYSYSNSQESNRIQENNQPINNPTGYSNTTNSNEMEMPATFMGLTSQKEETPTVDYTSNRPQAVGAISRKRLIRNEVLPVQETHQEYGDVEEMRPPTYNEEISKPVLHNMPATFTPSNTTVESNYEAATNSEAKEKPLSHLPLVDPYADNGEGLYRLQVARQNSNGYSIQVGAYAEYGNVLRQTALMQQHFSEPVIVHISKNRNRTLYKLMLGEFDTRTAAIDFMRTVQARGVDCMVKDLSIH